MQLRILLKPYKNMMGRYNYFRSIDGSKWLNNYPNPTRPDSKVHAFPLHHAGIKPCLRPGKDGINGCRPYYEELGAWKSPEKFQTLKHCLGVPYHQPEHFGPKVTFRTCVQTPKNTCAFTIPNSSLIIWNWKLPSQYSPVEPSDSSRSRRAEYTETRGAPPD